MKGIQAFANYPPSTNSDELWGLRVTTCGYSFLKENDIYPPREHPSSYSFSWENGRILNEYQIIYISKGEGVFESKSMRLKKVHAGDVILLFPGEWHRYKPSAETGWDEYWVGSIGSFADRLLKNKFISKALPILSVGLHEILIQKFKYICDQSQKEPTGFQHLISGEVMALYGNILCYEQSKHYENTETIAIVEKAKQLFQEQFQKNASVEEVAKQMNISYSRFRKLFRDYTGLAPNQYILHLKIQKSKELIASTHKTYKEIAEECSFENGFYFSRIFKTKTGLSPDQYRKRLQMGRI